MSNILKYNELREMAVALGMEDIPKKKDDLMAAVGLYLDHINDSQEETIVEEVASDPEVEEIPVEEVYVGKPLF